MASTKASSVSRFSVKPNTSMNMPAPISESGIVIIGMITARGDPRKMKITKITMTTASPSVHSTSLMALEMNFVES